MLLIKIAKLQYRSLWVGWMACPSIPNFICLQCINKFLKKKFCSKVYTFTQIVFDHSQHCHLSITSYFGGL